MNFDLKMPEGLSTLGQEAHAKIMEFLEARDMLYTCGGQAFYSPSEWKKRGEQYGLKSEMIIVHDGGDLAACCNLDYECYKLNEQFIEKLAEAGVYIEQCTSWYSAVYKI